MKGVGVAVACRIDESDRQPSIPWIGFEMNDSRSEGIFGLNVIEKIYLSQETICRDPPRHFHQGIYR
jgi:hypothetical protein